MDSRLDVRSYDTVTFTYVNWRGEESKRKATVAGFFWGSTEYHPETQMFMRALDLDKKEYRDFAVKDIKAMRVAGKQAKLI